VLNRGYRFGKRRRIETGDSGKRSPEFYVFPVDVVQNARIPGDAWSKADTRKIANLDSYKDNWDQVREFLGRSRPV
jgi:hypothetical protein